jgi:hypothetical protein
MDLAPSLVSTQRFDHLPGAFDALLRGYGLTRTDLDHRTLEAYALLRELSMVSWLATVWAIQPRSRPEPHHRVRTGDQPFASWHPLELPSASRRPGSTSGGCGLSVGWPTGGCTTCGRPSGTSVEACLIRTFKVEWWPLREISAGSSIPNTGGGRWVTCSDGGHGCRSQRSWRCVTATGPH